MRILQVIPSLAKGGAERVVVELSNSLVALDYKVDLLAAHSVDFSLNQNLLSPKVEVLFVGKKHGSPIFTYIKIPIWVAKNWKMLKSYDVSHCHLTFGLMFGFVISVFRKFTRSKKLYLIATCHVVGVGVTLRPRIINEHFSNFFDSFVLVAEDNLWRAFISKSGRHNFKVIKNGISPELWADLGRNIGDKNPIIVGTISRLEAERKPWLFLEVFAHLYDLTDRQVRFILGGEGPEKDRLVSYAKQLGINENLELPGLVFDPREILTLLDFYVGLCVEETTGIAALEAVFSGIPVVGIQLSEAYSKGENDWIYSHQDPKIVANRLNFLIQNPTEMATTSISQKVIGLQNYSIKRMCSKYVDLYLQGGARPN